MTKIDMGDVWCGCLVCVVICVPCGGGGHARGFGRGLQSCGVDAGFPLWSSAENHLHPSHTEITKKTPMNDSQQNFDTATLESF